MITPVTIDPYNEPQNRVRGLVSERHRRWSDVLRRLLPSMLPPGALISIIPSKPDEVLRQIRSEPRSLVWWEAQTTDFADRFRRIIEVSTESPSTLQIVSATWLDPDATAALLEIGVSAMVRRPEEVPRLTPMIAGYFAASGQSLD